MKHKKNTQTAVSMISTRIFADDLRNICNLLEKEGLSYKIELDECELDSEDMQSSDLSFLMKPSYSIYIHALENYENTFKISIDKFGTRFFYDETVKNIGIYHTVRKIINKRTSLWDYLYAYRVLIPFLFAFLSFLSENRIIKWSLILFEFLSLIFLFKKEKVCFVPRMSSEKNNFFSRNKDELLTQFFSQLGVFLIGFFLGLWIK